MSSLVSIQTTLCEEDRALIMQLNAKVDKLLQLQTTGDPQKKWLKSQEVEKRLLVSDSTLRRWRKKGKLVFDPIKRRYREDSVISMAVTLHIKTESWK